LVALGFVVLGLLAFSTRFYSRSQVETGLQESLWRLTYDIGFDKDGPQAHLRVSLPTSTRAAEVEVEELSHTGLVAEIRETPQSQNRELHLSTDLSGPYHVVAEFDIRLRPDHAWDEQNAKVILTSGARNRFLRTEEIYNAAGSLIRKALVDIPRGDMTDGEYVQKLFEYTAQSLKDPRFESNATEAQRAEGLRAASDVATALAYHEATPLGRARALVTLCRAARIPARLITGFELRQSENAEPKVWMEAFYGNRWVPFDPTNGFARYLPANYLPIRRDPGGEEGETLVHGTGTTAISQRYTIVRLAPPEKLLQSEMRRPSQVFDLTRLPVEMHEVMSLMLLLPLGALITAIFRNMIGIRTLGTFAPALLAMSFIYAAWGTGLVILISVLIVGYIGRKALDRLHLLMVPRSSIVLTIIILCVVFGVSVIDYMAPASGVRAVLLPLVILTILIERFFVTAEEDGTTFAIQLVVGTFVVAAFCYLILSWEEIGQILLIYPELHFFTIAAFIWIGRYSGYRLVELWRFRDMVK
jgi:hypothetical protein